MLTRREKGEIVIADQITVKVVNIRGNQVRLAIETPREIQVLRVELALTTTGKTATG